MSNSLPFTVWARCSDPRCGLSDPILENTVPISLRGPGGDCRTNLENTALMFERLNDSESGVTRIIEKVILEGHTNCFYELATLDEHQQGCCYYQKNLMLPLAQQLFPHATVLVRLRVLPSVDTPIDSVPKLTNFRTI